MKGFPCEPSFFPLLLSGKGIGDDDDEEEEEDAEGDARKKSLREPPKMTRQMGSNAIVAPFTPATMKAACTD